MAEAYANTLFPNDVKAYSAGLEAGVLNPIAVEVMHEDGIDISQNATTTVDEFLSSNISIDVVITVCDEASAERCPFIPGLYQRLIWNFRDPSAFTGTHVERLAQTRIVRDEIKARIEEWCQTISNS